MTDEHLSLDELAELDEGILTPERASAARAHLDGCAQCRAAADAITATRGILTDLPDVPMPDAVKARLDKALADAAPKSSATVVPQLDDYRRRRFGRPTAAASAAAAAIVLVVGGIVVGAVLHGSSSSGGGPGETSAAANGAIPTAEPVQPKDYKRTSTGLNYTPKSLLSDIPGLVATVPGATFGSEKAAAPSVAVPSAGPGPTQQLETGPVPKALRPLFDSHAKLLQCAATMTGESNAVPIAADFARWTNPIGNYHAAPSIVLVFRDPNPDVVDVYVAAPDCGTADLRTYVKVPLQ